jgi:hypothetical protein
MMVATSRLCRGAARLAWKVRFQEVQLQPSTSALGAYRTFAPADDRVCAFRVQIFYRETAVPSEESATAS